MNKVDRLQCVPVQGPASAAAALVAFVAEPLAVGKKVLWLVSGGTTLPIASAVSQRLQSVDTSKLFVTLVDDKVNPSANTKNNWQQLIAGGFVAGKATMHQIVHPNETLAQAAERFDRLLTERLAWADVAIGQFGIGAAQHTGGIMPSSAAARETTRLAIGYEHDGEAKITITPALIRRLDIAFINSFGEAKRQLVHHFLRSTADNVAEPTQSLKTARHAYLYSDILSKT